MIQVEFDKPNNLLRIVFSNRVPLAEAERSVEDARTSLADADPGFRLLTDLTALEFMDPACATPIKRTMDLCQQRGISKVVRVIPNPQKDIGFTIMSLFHYKRSVQVVTCESLEEARQVLGISQMD